ncbi:MAG: DUF1570 domain-containing protein [Planctomycetaceae bacterium]|jgi:hypothetical protein|nr:DUF1570 domain-containing protein [Planctomycetaceae bacterium]
MSLFTNNKRLALVIGVKFTLVSFAILSLFIGTYAAGADDVSSPTAPISKGEKSLSPEPRRSLFSPSEGKFLPDGKILESLRFWEKVKKQPNTDSAAPTVVPSRPQEVSKMAGGSVTERPSPQTPSAKTGTAPEPPPNPYAVRERFETGDAPLPTGHVNHVYRPDTTSTQEASPMKTSSSSLSYSFDARDWVEFFPLQQGQERVASREDAPIATQPTSLRLSTSSPLPYRNENEDDRWNGQSTALPANLPHDVAPTVAAPNEKMSAIDMSPSYEKRLPYVQTCGVVVVQANFPLKEIAAILDEIQQLQHDLNCYMGVPEPKEKIELCLFRNEETYISFLRDYFPKAPRDRRALYVKLDDKPGTLLVQKSNDFEVDLRHEMTHAIIHASIQNVPIWLDEGLAKYFEVPSSDRVSNHPYMAQVRWSAKFGLVPSLDRLNKLETIDDMGVKEYRDSWAWTHFMIHRSPETHRMLADYLQMLATWSPQERTVAGRIPVIGKWKDEAVRDPIPPLKPYMDKIVSNQREAFREHYRTEK